MYLVPQGECRGELMMQRFLAGPRPKLTQAYPIQSKFQLGLDAGKVDSVILMRATSPPCFVSSNQVYATS